MKDQQARIVAAIAAYLEENTFLNDSDIYAPEITFGIVKEYPTPTHTECCKELADQITAAIAPHLEAGAGWKPQIDEIVLVDGKIEGSFRGMRAGLACIAFKGGMQMNIALDRVTPG